MAALAALLFIIFTIGLIAVVILCIWYWYQGVKPMNEHDIKESHSWYNGRP